MSTCPTCRINPEGPSRVGVTPRGHVFVSRACASCQEGVDRAVLKEMTRRFGFEAVLTLGMR